MNHGYFQPEHYISMRILRALGTVYVRESLPDTHKTHRGMSDVDAEFKYIKDAQQIQDYGYHFYSIYRSKKTSLAPLFVGLSIRGIVLGNRHVDSIRQRSFSYAWSDVQKVSYSRRRFSIQPKMEQPSMKNDKMNFYTENYRKGRYLVQLSNACHHFHLRQSRVVDLADMLQEELPMSEGEEGAAYFDDDKNTTIQGRQDNDYSDEDDNVEGDYSDGQDNDVLAGPRRMEPHYHNLPAYHNNTQSQPRMSRIDQHIRSNNDSNNHYMSQKEVNKSTNEFFHDPGIDKSSYAMHGRGRPVAQVLSTQSPERKILVVDLRKNSLYGTGIKIVGGENTGKMDLGLFIKSITPGSPAHEDGRLCAGDRVIAINGNSLEGMSYHEANHMIDNSPPIVQLMVSQTKMSVGPEVGSPSRDSSISLDEAALENLLAAGGLVDTPSNRFVIGWDVFEGCYCNLYFRVVTCIFMSGNWHFCQCKMWVQPRPSDVESEFQS